MQKINFKNALLVEDEPALGEALGQALSKLGIPFVWVPTLKDAKEALLTKNEKALEFDIVLLDRMLPDGEGLDLCNFLRQKKFTGAILILSALGETHHRITGLNLGADDYLPKPFSWQEFEAKLRALSRRFSGSAPPLQNEKNSNLSTVWTLKTETQEVLGPVGWARLTPIEFKFFQKLLQNSGKILTREELLKDVWGYRWLPKTRTVDFFLGRLRKQFEPDPDQPKHFHTVRGVGVRFDP